MNIRQHHDHNAERALLGGILVDNRRLQLVGDLEVDDFHSPRHQLAWSAIANIDSEGVDAIDPVTVAAELKRQGRDHVFGDYEGAALGFLLDLLLNATVHVEHCAEILKKHRTTREARLAASELLERTNRPDDECEGDGAVQFGLSRLLAIRSRAKDPGRTMAQLIQDELASLDADLEALHRGEDVRTGTPTGIRRLDAGTGGYPIGAVTLVMGGTGHGKSTFLGAGARATAADEDFAFVYSFEDPAKFWGQRGLAQESGIPTEAIARRRDLDHALQMRDDGRGEFAARRLARARDKAWQRREVIIPAAGMTVDQLIADARSRRTRMQAQLGGRKRRLAVFVDYIQVIRLVFSRGLEKRTDAIAFAMDRLQWLAQGCGNPDDACAVIVASQVDPEVEAEKRAPTKDDWCDSASTVKVSKMVLGLHRAGAYDASLNQLLGSVLLLKRNQGLVHVEADAIFDLAIHTIRGVDEVEDAERQRTIGGVS